MQSFASDRAMRRPKRGRTSIGGFFSGVGSAMIAPIFPSVRPMSQDPSTLYAKLLGETAVIPWQQLQPFFAKGALLWVAPDLDLIAVAEAMAENDAAKISAWMAEERVSKLSETRALDFVERDPQLWAVVVAPWVVIQERALA